ncbi:MAG: MBL fold metallo-hydrolase [Rhodocyclaceae bacterium]|nr:MBL fold metallo-hydrolase [Rhodocyclaceae bacterium]MBK6908588.1 MBL fold metallo-hydrolase [Rhodocyclaceae bacterium]
MTTTLDYPFPDLPALGAAVQLVPGLAWLRMPLPFALDHINLWLLDDGAEGEVAAVDTGFCSDVIKDAWKSALAGRRLTRSVCTHGHPDHLGLAKWLESEFGAPLWITQGEYLLAQLLVAQAGPFTTATMIAFFARHGLDAERLAALEMRGNSYGVGVPHLPATYRRIFPGDTLRVGQHDWRVIIGYGHAPEHAALYCPDLGVLISGDMLLPRISTNVPVVSTCPDDNPLQQFLDSIDRFLELPDDTLVLPSHGRPFRGIKERVRQLHEHHENRCAALIAPCREPRTAAELIPVLFERDIPDPHQVMFAMGEAIAHLNLLQHRSQLRRIDEAGLTRYVVN